MESIISCAQKARHRGLKDGSRANLQRVALLSHAKTVHLSDEAASALKRLRERDGEQIAQSGRSIVLLRPGAQKTALLFHGLTASPKQFGEFARLLHARGFNVVVPRLPLHGRSDRLTDALERLHVDDLKRSTREAIALCELLGGELTVVGFSLGGVLACWAAQHFALDRVVAVAPFLGVRWIPRVFARSVAAWVLLRRNRFVWWDPIQRERQMPDHGYPRYSTHAVAHSYLLGHELFADAGKRAPSAREIVLVTNARETTVDNRAVNALLRKWRWRRHRGIETRRLHGLPYSHDIIDPLRNPAIAARVYPVLLEITDPQRPG